MSEWTSHKLRASDADGVDFFSRAVSISGDALVIGASGEDGGAGDPLGNAGAAYVFDTGMQVIYLPVVVRNDR